jgi:hypothetical protein
MNNLTKDAVREAADCVHVADRLMAVWRFCQRPSTANRGVMCMHYISKRSKPAGDSSQVDPLMRKPLCDRSPAFACVETGRDACTERCSGVWQNHSGAPTRGTTTNNKAADSGASHTHSSSAASDCWLSGRYRTLNMLRCLAAGPGDRA